MSTTETVSIVMAERRSAQPGETDAMMRQVRVAIAAAKETARYNFFNTRNAANGDAAAIRAAEKTYYAAIDGSTPVTYTIG